MATFTTAPQWSPDPVSSLPSATTITYTVKPGPFADRGIQIEYELSSAKACFETFSGAPPIPTEESDGSLPKGADKSCTEATEGLAACSREAFRIVDRYPAATSGAPLQITRVLRLQALPGGSSTFSQIKVSVSDVTTSGATTIPRSRLASVRI